MLEFRKNFILTKKVYAVAFEEFNGDQPIKKHIKIISIIRKHFLMQETETLFHVHDSIR